MPPESSPEAYPDLLRVFGSCVSGLGRARQLPESVTAPADDDLELTIRLTGEGINPMPHAYTHWLVLERSSGLF
jgi:hypothetical protein